jgi:hypothetical protein
LSKKIAKDEHVKQASKDIKKIKEDVKKFKEDVKKTKVLDSRIEILNKLSIGKRLLFSSQTFSIPRRDQKDAM